MSATSPCIPCCPTPVSVNVPGVQGADGTNGTNGANAFALATADDTLPASLGVGGAKTYAVDDSTWMVVGQVLILAVTANTWANLQVTAVPSAISVTVMALGYPGDQPLGTAFLTGAKFSPAGLRGGGTLYYYASPIDVTLTPYMDVVDLTVTAKTATLPTAVGIAGKVYTVKLSAAAVSTGTVATTGGQTIDGAANYALSAHDKYVTVVSDGANWLIIGNN